MTATTTTRQRLVPRVALSLDRSGGANPADAAAANINTIVAQYRKTGTLPNVSMRNPLYGDFTFPEDMHSLREAVHIAEDRFDQLPSKVRTLCENDWVQFHDRFNQVDSRAELVEAGLVLNENLPTATLTNTPPIQGVMDALNGPEGKTPKAPDQPTTKTALEPSKE